MFEAERIIWKLARYHDKPHSLGKELIKKGVFIMKNSQFSADTVARKIMSQALQDGILDEADFKYGGVDAAMHGHFMLQSIGMDLDELIDRLEYEKHLLARSN